MLLVEKVRTSLLTLCTEDSPNFSLLVTKTQVLTFIINKTSTKGRTLPNNIIKQVYVVHLVEFNFTNAVLIYI